MKKRIISLLMALALCLSLLPTAALAAEGEPAEQLVEQEQLKPVEPTPAEPEEGAPVEDAEEEEKEELPEEPKEEQEEQPVQPEPAMLAMANGVALQAVGVAGHTNHDEGWTAISTADALTAINAAGNYYLTNNIEISTTWQPVTGVVLCLNGHSITMTDRGHVIEVLSGVTFTLTDCKGTGKITHTDGQTGLGVGVAGTFNMCGGKITGNTVENSDTGIGGGVRVVGTFNMYGGSITGNRASIAGGGVYVKSGTFEMSGGTIGGTGTGDANQASSGGGVYVSGGTFTMSGGTITGNKVSYSYGDGGGVFVNYNGTFNMSDDSRITGNTAFRGGGVCVERNSVGSNNYKPGNFAMSSGTIGGTATNDANQAEYGGGVYVAGTFTLTGGSITGNKTNGNGGGVYVNADSTFTVSGAPKITNNTQKTTTSSNVYLNRVSGKNAVITIAGKLEDDAKIGVTLTNNYGDNAFTSGWNAKMSSKAPSDYFIFDVGGKGFELSGGEVKLSDGHSHYLCGGDTCTKVGHDQEAGTTTFKAWTKTNSLPSADGNYYLTEDVTLSSTWAIQNNAKNVVLCLNGHTIKMTGDDNVINVWSNKRLTLTDCAPEGKAGTVTHADGTTGRGVYVSANSTFTLYGGSITGNKTAYSYGGGVLVYAGTFNMCGGSVSGNEAGSNGGGVYVYNGTFNMSGGSISGNNANGHGGGVYVRGGTFDMSGGSISGNNTNGYYGGVYVKDGTFKLQSGSITGNYADGTLNSTSGLYEKGATGADSNVYLPKDKKIDASELNGGTIGVTTEDTPAAGAPVAIATGAKDGVGYSSIFTPDVKDQDYTITRENDKVYLTAHTHNWAYSVSSDGATITTACGGCGKSGSVTIKAPAALTYDGTTKAAIVDKDTGNWQGSNVTIVYKQGDKVLTGAPVNAGTYTASITAGGETASVEYTIAKATPTVSGSGTASGTYGQKLSEVTVNDLTAMLNNKTVAGSWALTDNTSDTLDSVGNAIEYTAVFTPSDTDNYNSTTAKVAVTVNPKAGGSLGTVNLAQKFTDTAEKTYTPNWAGLPDGENWSYVSDMTTSNGGITLNKNDFDADGKKLIYSISGGQVNDTVTFTLEAICADNHYEPFTITVVVKLTDKDTPTVKANNINVTYTGENIPASAITGTAIFDIVSVAGTWSWKSTAPKNVADSGNHTVVFTPADSANYSSVETIITVTIAKATPIGEPKYTKITAGGKTLADAGLTVTGSTLSPNAGDLVWVDDAGNALLDATVVEKNTTYKWRFTPNDANYEALTGSVELYHVSGGYYYYTPAAGGTTDANKSPRTGDAGLLVYGLTALSSYTGTALVLRRKRED
jgi:hypothetical protein